MAVIVVMGVSGSGKTTVGTELARRLGVPFLDADDFHSPAALAQMGAGRPLTDAQRGPWLDRVRDAIGAHVDTGVVVACSALTPAIRARLTRGLTAVRYVWLRVPAAELERRLRDRVAHGGANPVGPSLLPSQLELLEPPTDAVVVDVAPSSKATVDQAYALLAAGAPPEP